MKRRDDFSPDVKRALAARAGYRCSVCEKPTIGAGSTPDSVLSDGIAAHITAAAPGGPRFDSTLSTDQRRGVENGIWCCTQHGREIDSDAPGFTTELLRGLKRRREELAKKQLSGEGAPGSSSAVLVDFPHAQTALRLFEIISPQPYTFATTASVRDLLSLATEPARLLDLASEVIIATWESHPNVAGILTTLLSNNIDLWQPPPAVLEKLQDLCERAIRTDDWTQVAAVEPLAFALSGKGHPRVHRDVLERLVNAPAWRTADATRVREYYGTVGNEIAAIFRHWNDQFRNGLLKANDVARLIDLLLSNDVTLRSGPGRRSLLDLLQDHAVVLQASGEAALAGSVVEFVEAFRYSNRV
jgi:hypothetical protein